MLHYIWGFLAVCWMILKYNVWPVFTNTWFWVQTFFLLVPNTVWYALAGFSAVVVFLYGLLKYEERQLTQDVHLFCLDSDHRISHELFMPIRKQVIEWQKQQADGKSLGHDLITKLEETQQILEIQAGKIREEMKKHVEAQMEAYRNEVIKARGEFKAQVLLLLDDLKAEMKGEIEAIVEQRISDELKKRVKKGCGQCPSCFDGVPCGKAKPKKATKKAKR